MAESSTNYITEQLCYYGVDSPKNNPNSYLTWLSNVLESRTGVVKLGIQTLPGIHFAVAPASEGIYIDHTGIYEIDLKDTTTTISLLRFFADSLIKIEETNNASIIIDILYKTLKTEGT